MFATNDWRVPKADMSGLAALLLCDNRRLFQKQSREAKP